jgi:hypothetical protein
MSKSNLYNGTIDDIRNFAVAIVGLAGRDHVSNVAGRSGAELTDLLTGSSRIMHRRMATSLYNNTRRTLELFDEECQ